MNIGGETRYKGKTEYRGIYLGQRVKHGRPQEPKFYYNTSGGGQNLSSGTRYATAREAAIALDKRLIGMGLEPRNIFKRQTTKHPSQCH